MRHTWGVGGRFGSFRRFPNLLPAAPPPFSLGNLPPPLVPFRPPFGRFRPPPFGNGRRRAEGTGGGRGDARGEEGCRARIGWLAPWDEPSAAGSELILLIIHKILFLAGHKIEEANPWRSAFHAAKLSSDASVLSSQEVLALSEFKRFCCFEAWLWSSQSSQNASDTALSLTQEKPEGKTLGLGFRDFCLNLSTQGVRFAAVRFHCP
ncbi:Hypothetical predicted protein [Podarcis lilfordi]|uniref:Uncharacterized protein n=1 Tax=Podarcis lilfordi TaxID=74358 RepID=A0AA35K6N5_9SAUR|nr:Hypothetical predicted protein [Podarcis lilfordi]